MACRWRVGMAQKCALGFILRPCNEGSPISYLNYVFLFTAIVSEVIATNALKATDGFTKVGPSILTVVGYASAFYFLSLTLKAIPIGVAYATWSGVGILLISLVGWLYYKETLSVTTMLGMALIVAGVVVVNLSAMAH